jgi:transcriptional regulator
MPRSTNRLELVQGTLDMLILRTLRFGPAHGHQIAKHIEQTTDDLLRVDHGSLYPALYRLVRNGWIVAKWEKRKERNREFKFYRLTAAGRRQLRAEESRWDTLVQAIAQVMRPVEGT